MQKVTSIYHIILEIQQILEYLETKNGHTHFWPHPPQYFSINFEFPLISVNMQKIRLSSFYSRDIIELKIQQSDWPRACWTISQESDFSQICNLCMNISNNINFHQ